MTRTPVAGSRLLILFAVGLLGLEIAAAGQAAPAPAEQPKTAGLDTDAHLVGWWKFDDASGATAADSSKQGRNGTLQGGLSFDKDSAPGRTGKALKFDGKEGFVQITGYKGVGGTAPSIMYPREKINPFCMGCHPKDKMPAARHAAFLAGTAKETYCTDCHGKHRLAQRKCKWKQVWHGLRGPPLQRQAP